MKMTKIALGVALAAGTVAVQAKTILFPYITSNGNSVTTIVSVINDGVVAGYTSAGAPGGDRLHWIYVNKSGPAAASTEATCAELDYYLPHSANDIQTVDLGGLLSNAADRGVLFSDPSTNNTWRGDLAGSTLTYALAQASAGGQISRGYLLVEDILGGAAETPMSGQAMVFDYGTGAAWGYKSLTEGTVASGSYATSSVAGNQPAAANAPVQVNFFPLDETVTRFLVTPVPTVAGQTLLPTDPNVGAYRVALGIGTSAWVAFDRDENAVSGMTPRGVTCVGSVDLVELMAPGARTILQNGGWTQLYSGLAAPSPGTTPTDRAYVYHLEFGGGLNYRNNLGETTNGNFNGSSATGTFNNAFRVL